MVLFLQFVSLKFFLELSNLNQVLGSDGFLVPSFPGLFNFFKIMGVRSAWSYVFLVENFGFSFDLRFVEISWFL